MRTLTFLFLCIVCNATVNSYTYPDFSNDYIESGIVNKTTEIMGIISQMKSDYNLDLIFARVNISKFNSGYYDCCVRIPNLFCSNGNITAEGWTSNITIRCAAILYIDYMLVFRELNVTLPPMEPPSDPPSLPPTEPTFLEYPLSNKVIIILLGLILVTMLLFVAIYSFMLLTGRLNPKKKILEIKKNGQPQISQV